MDDNTLVLWAYNHIEGDPEKECEVLKIALCQSYQKQYTDIETLCKNAGLGNGQAEMVKKWKQNGRIIPYYEIKILYDYICYYEKERFIRAVKAYYRNNFLI